MAIKILDAATDGVTSSWTVPLDSGPAASRDHATVLLSLPRVTLTGDDTTYSVNVGGPSIGGPSAQTFPATGAGVNNASALNFFAIAVDRYRDAHYAIWGDGVDESSTRNPGGAAVADGPINTLEITLTALPSGNPVAPPAGGRVEVWVG